MPPDLSRRRFAQLLLAIGSVPNSRNDFGGSAQRSHSLESVQRTPNHNYVYPTDKSEKWAAVADAIDHIDVGVEIRDRIDNRNQYTPRAGAKFLDTESGAVAIADGEQWQELDATGFEPTFRSVNADQYNGVTYVDPSDGYDRLQTVLADLGDEPGKVVLGPGRFDDIDGNVTVPSNTLLAGQGRATTTLAFANDADLDLAGLLRIEGQNVSITDLEIDGNRENVTDNGQEYGLYTSGARYVTVDSVACRNCPGYGFDPHADGGTPSQHVTFYDCLSRNNGRDGFTFAGVEYGMVIGSVALENDRHGINGTDTEGDGLTVIDCVMRDNGGTGLVMQNTYGDVTATANTIEGNGADGIRVGNGGSISRRITVANNLVRDNRRYGANLRACRSVTISGNQFHGNNVSGTGTAEIATTGTADGAREVLITGNQFRPREWTDHAVDERDGEGPMLVATNVIRGGSESAISTSHPDTIAELNLVR